MFTEDIQTIGEALGLEGKFCIQWGFSQILEAIQEMKDVINPPPEMEEVEVKRWGVMDPTKDGWRLGATLYVERDETFERLVRQYPGRVAVELTGHYSRPVKKKVMKREEIPRPREYGQFTNKIPSDAKFFAEWPEEK